MKLEGWQSWVAILTLVLGVLAWVVQASVDAGKIEARVGVIEKSQSHGVSREEWNLFAKDTSARLDRIEGKLDQHMLDMGEHK